MSRKSSTTALCWAFTTLSASTAHALPLQQVGQPGSGPEELNLEMTGDTGLAFRRTCAGDFDGSGLVDLVAVRNGKLEIVGDPALFGWRTGNLGFVSDLALLDPVNPDLPDTLVTVGSNGAQEWSHFEQANAVTGESAPTVGTLAASAWLGARKVATGEVSGELRPRIVGCMADQRSIRSLRWAFSNNVWGYVDEAIPLSPPLATGAVVLDLGLVDFVGNGLPKLAVLTVTSLRIYDLATGVELVQYTGASGWSNACMTIGSAGPNGPDWLARVVNHPDGIRQYLVTVDSGGANPTLYLQGDPGVVAMDAGSYKDEVAPGATPDTVDLILSVNATNNLWILLNEPDANGPAFSLSPTRKLVLTYPSTSTGLQGNEAFPVLEDVDNDGDLDVLFPVRLTSSLYVRFNDRLQQDKLRPAILPEAPNPALFTPSIYTLTDGSLSLSVYVNAAETVPSAATDLQLAVFNKETIASNTDRVSWPSYLVPKSSIPSLQYVALLAPDPSSPAALPPDAASNVARFENLYVVLSRYVTVSNGSVVRAYPGSFYGLETSAYNDNHVYMQSFSPSFEMTCYYGGLIGPETGTTGDEIGTLTLLPSMPTPPDGPVIVQ